jgi:hypothetical protein
MAGFSLVEMAGKQGIIKELTVTLTVTWIFKKQRSLRHKAFGLLVDSCRDQ